MPVPEALCFLSEDIPTKRTQQNTSIPYDFNLKARPSCHTLSKALEIPTKTALIFCDRFESKSV